MWTDHKPLAKDIGKMFHLSSLFPLPRGKDTTIPFVHITSCLKVPLFFIRYSLYWPMQDRSLWFSKLYSWENISIEGSVTCLRWVNKLLTGEKLEFTSEWSDFQRRFYCFLDLVNLELSVGGWQEVYWLMLAEYRNSIPIWW